MIYGISKVEKNILIDGCLFIMSRMSLFLFTEGRDSLFFVFILLQSETSQLDAPQPYTQVCHSEEYTHVIR